MTENEKKLWLAFDTASKKVKDVGKSSAGDEKAYTVAYQNLVKAGLAHQIKQKYR